VRHERRYQSSDQTGGAAGRAAEKRSDWQFTESPLPEPRDEEALARVLYLSLDPAMRGWMNEGKSYIAPVAIGDVMRAGAVGKIVASKHPKFAEAIM
jgi:NADPH-dependent curcumin reductase